MTPTDHNTNTASTPKTGLFALLCGYLPRRGAGAPKISAGTGASLRRLVFSALVTALGALVFAAAPALAAAPTVITESTSPTVKPSEELRLEATVNAGEEATGTTECDFQYGGISVSEHTVACEQGTPAGMLEGGEQAVAVTVAGLQAGTTYAYRVVLKNASGKQEGGDEKVTTLPVPSTEVPSPIGATTATFKGKLTPFNSTFPAEYYFSYIVGEEAFCLNEHETGRETASAEAVSTKVTELEPHQKYTVCLVSTNTLGDTEEDLTPKYFETKPAPPTVESESAPSVMPFEARLVAVVNPNNEPTVECEFQYGKTTSYGAERACEPGVLEGGAPEAAATSVSGLTPGTTYHYRIVVKNATGTSEGTGEFTTPAAEKPVVAEESASAVTSSTATLGAQVNPSYQETTCELQYGTSSTLATSTSVPCEPKHLGNGASPVAVTAAVGGLAAGETYYYRAVAENKTGVQDGPTEHFTTVPTPNTDTPSPVAASTATLNGHLTLDSVATKYSFDYRAGGECTGTGGVSTPTEEAGTGAGNANEAVPVAGLLPHTLYTVCFVTSNAFGSEQGPPVTFETLAAAPTITSEYVTKVQATTATLNAEIDPNGATTTYHFEYIDQAGYETALAESAPNPYAKGQSTPESEPIGADDTDHAALASLTGLTPGTTYHYRAVATNSQSLAGGTPGPDKTFTTPAEPSATAETCPNAKARTEQPYGQALPDCRAYELVSPLDKNDQDVAAIDSRAAVSDEAPAVAYASTGSFSGSGGAEPQGARKINRYISRRGADGWSTQSLTPLSVAFESERVAFAELLFTPDLSQGLVLSENVPLVEDEPEGFRNLYVADLASSPVSYQTVTTVKPPGLNPYEGGVSAQPEAEGVSTDLSHVVFYQPGLGVFEWADGKLSSIVGGVGAPGRSDSTDAEFGGDDWHAVSADGLRVFGSGVVSENPEQEPSRLNGQGECTEPAKACTVDYAASQRTGPHGEPDPDPHDYDPQLEAPYPAYYRDANTEGTRVFFTSRAELTDDANTGPADNAANLYEYELSSEPGKPGKLTDLTVNTEPGGAAVLGLATASEDGSYVYFVANGVLASNENTNKETAQPGSCREEELEKLTGEHTCSLYVSHYNDGKWEAPRFIATLAGGRSGAGGEQPVRDERDWVGYEGGVFTEDWGPGRHTVRVTPDGTTLAFESERSLTGYDNEPVEPGGAGAGIRGTQNHCTETGNIPQNNPAEPSENNLAVPCREVYLYDAVTGKLVCASCDPSGARPVGPAELGGQELERFLAPSVYYRPRNLSENGGRLFFQSPDALVPHDTDGGSGCPPNSDAPEECQDVYEWELPASPAEAANGENSCTPSASTFSASSGGCLLPISDVAGAHFSSFMDASPSGNNVFIATKDQLVPAADADSRANVYDVRVGGGFPVTPAPPVCNNGDSCKPPVSSQPGVFGAPASATFSGPGNPVPPPPLVVKPAKKTVKCKKGFTRKKNKCVRHKSKKRKAKKSVHTNRRAK